MSADNWTECPVCEERFPLVKQETEFREDYEFWLDAKTKAVHYSYSGWCERCGSGVMFTGQQPITVAPPRAWKETAP